VDGPPGIVIGGSNPPQERELLLFEIAGIGKTGRVIRTVGVEEEFLLARSSSPALAAAGDEVVAAAEAGSDGQFEHEFKREQAELGTSPQESMADLANDLVGRRLELAEGARREGVRLLASATSPVDEHVTSTANDRYERMTSLFGRVARMQLTCGMHVHVAVDSPEEGVAVLDRLRPWLAVLLALSANSPFLAGQDTDYASYRTILWGQWPTSGVTDAFGGVEGYERARAALVTSGAAIDDGMIYFDARLSARYPTVEIRVADVCIDPKDAVVIAALARGLVDTAAQEWADGRPVVPLRSELLRAATWRAARWGAEQDLIDVLSPEVVPAWDLIGRLVDWVAPALDVYGDTERVTAGLADIRRRGTGAPVQRQAYAANGFDGIADAVTVSPDG
jgi:glutamate---cysteine ligase / carboxylate-amine ligase